MGQDWKHRCVVEDGGESMMKLRLSRYILNNQTLIGSACERRCPHEGNNISFCLRSISSHGTRMPILRIQIHCRRQIEGVLRPSRAAVGGLRLRKCHIRTANTPGLWPQHVKFIPKAAFSCSALQKVLCVSYTNKNIFGIRCREGEFPAHAICARSWWLSCDDGADA